MVHRLNARLWPSGTWRRGPWGHEGRLCPGTVYVAPPGIHFVVDERRRFALVDGPKVKHSRPSADRLFASAAEAFKAQVMALVLTGGDGDGSGGVLVVKRHGGTVVAQNEASARDPSMPKAAIATGDVDYILPLTHIASTLEDLVFLGKTRPDPLVA